MQLKRGGGGKGKKKNIVFSIIVVRFGHGCREGQKEKSQFQGKKKGEGGRGKPANLRSSFTLSSQPSESLRSPCTLGKKEEVLFETQPLNIDQERGKAKRRGKKKEIAGKKRA